MPGAAGPARVRPHRRRALEPHLRRHRRRRAAATCCAARRSATCSPPPTTWAASTRSSPPSAPPTCPSPRPSGLCTDESVNGAPFYVMDFVDGLVLRDAGAAERHHRRAPAATPSESIADDPGRRSTPSIPTPSGLGDLGKKEGYIARQLKRWYGQFEQSKTRELPVDRRGARRAARPHPRPGPGRDRPRRLPPRQLHDRRRRQRDRRPRLGDLHARRPARRRRAADGLLDRRRTRAAVLLTAPTAAEGFLAGQRGARRLRRRPPAATSRRSTSTSPSATGSSPASSRASTRATSAGRWAATRRGFEGFAHQVEHCAEAAADAVERLG